MTISSELSGALRYCGDIEGERIPLPTLYEFWLDSCSTMDADLQLSQSWRNVQLSPVFQIALREQVLPAIQGVDPAFEVGLDYRLAGTNNPWRTVQIVAPERVSDVESMSGWFLEAGWSRQSSSRVAAFYGFPRNIILSFDPALYEFRLWYVPSTAGDRSNVNEGASGLPETYAPLRKVLTAHKALPQCGYDDVTFKRLNDVILRELAIWQPRWDRYKDKRPKREGTRRPGFKRASRFRR